MDLSFLIPSRNEMFLAKTIESILSKIRGDSEIIAVLDGVWADPPILDHPRVTIIHRPESIGQRAATNLAARLSTAKYVCKIDAHCDIDEGFDVKLIAADQELGRPDVTQIPAQYNHHAFNWRCRACGRETYQGPTPAKCERKLVDGMVVPTELETEKEPCGSTAGFDRVLVWAPRRRRAAGNGSDGRGHMVRTEFWRFDQHLHFQYWDSYRDRPAAKGELVDVMSSLGACFFMRRDRFFAIGGLDEQHGSWGQYGTEIACKSWLSGGRHIVNKRTWFSHLFRTQGGDFGFPYTQDQRQVSRAREYSKRLWIDGTWPGAMYPLSWLLDKFAPVPDWPSASVEKLRSSGVASRAHDPKPNVSEPKQKNSAVPSKGLAYYSDCRGDQRVLTAVRDQITRAANGHRIVSVTLQPVDLGDNIHLALERGHLTMFRQQLAALEALDTDVAFMVEHDVLYHPSHFAFTPPDRTKFYYNQHTWRVDARTGQALFYLCSQVSGLCAYRDILIEHYRKRVGHVEQHGFDRNLGYEPGTNSRARALDGRTAETWMSPAPNVDIKTEFCLTPGRWSQDKFRNKNSCLGWTEADAVPGWGITKGRFDAFLIEVPAALVNLQGEITHAAAESH